MLRTVKGNLQICSRGKGNWRAAFGCVLGLVLCHAPIVYEVLQKWRDAVNREVEGTVLSVDVVSLNMYR